MPASTSSTKTRGIHDRCHTEKSTPTTTSPTTPTIVSPRSVPDASFPSGHVGTATALFGCTVVLVWVYARAVRRWVIPLLLLFPVLCLLSRLYEGAHHLTDVLTSMAYTCVWIAAVASLVLFRERAES